MQTVADLMITNLVTLKESDSLATAKALMSEKNIRNLPVIDDGKYVGFISKSRIFNAYRKKLIRQTSGD